MLRKLLFLIASIIAVSFRPALSDEVSDAEKKILFQTQKFKFILETLYKNYADTIDIDNISEVAFQALLQKLDDQSSYFTKQHREQFKGSYQGSRIGIGVNVQYIGDTLTIVNVSTGSPADSAGLEPGDKILFLDGLNTTTSDRAKIASLFSGDEGSTLKMIVRAFIDSGLKEYEIGRHSYKTSSISAAFPIQGTRIWYVDIDNFSRTSVEDFKQIAAKLKKEKAEGLILDLRANPGGYLEQVCKIIDDFLPKSKTITYTSARNPEYKVMHTSEFDGELRHLPMIILIDKGSASASEIFAGAIQDYDRGIVIGERSFGKGSVQKMWDISDGTAFRITVANYFTPLGRTIQRRKLSSVEEIELDPSVSLNLGKEAEQKMINLIKKTGGKSRLPLFTSEKGRTLIGGGGIYPDYTVYRDTTTALTAALNQKGILLEWAFAYLSSKREKLINSFGENFNKFATDFNLNDEDINNLSAISKSRNIWNDSMFVEDFELIKALMKATIANILWGAEEMKAVLIQFDKPVIKAIECLPEAKQMISER